MSLSPHDILVRGRALAETASDLRVRDHTGELLAFGQVAETELFVARCVVVTASVDACDLGNVLLRHSRPRDGLAMSLSGWAIARVAPGSRVVGPLPGDAELARRRLLALGLTPDRPIWRTA